MGLARKAGAVATLCTTPALLVGVVLCGQTCPAATLAGARAQGRGGAAQQSISVGLDKAHLRPLQPYFLGVNSGHLRDAFNWDDPAFQHALGNLNYIETLRFPAGTLADYWDWKSGRIVYPQSGGRPGHPEPEKPGAMTSPYPAPLSELATEISITHSSPLFVLNMLTDPVCGASCQLTPSSPSLKYQMEMLSVANAMGMHLDLLELGNEYYLPPKNYSDVYPNSDSKSEPLASVRYARLATQWIKTIKQKYPDAKISVLGAVTSIVGETWPGFQTERAKKWNAGLFDPSYNSASVGGDGKPAVQGADAVTLHVYPRFDLPPGATLDSSTAEDLLGVAFKQWDDIRRDELPQIPLNMPVWFTEFNLHRTSRAMGTWAHGLFVATESLLFMEDRRVQMETHHELVGDSGYGDLFYTKQAFAHTDDGASGVNAELATTQWGESAMADTLNLIGRAAVGADHAELLAFKNAPLLSDAKDNFGFPALYGWSFLHGTSSRLVVLNLSNRRLLVDLSKMDSHLAYDQISGDPGTYVTGGLQGSPSNLKEERGRVASASNFALPPFSITLIDTGAK